MAKIITANIEEIKRVDFRQDKFDSLIEQKGLNLEWYKAIVCPCRKEVTSQANSNCINCKGTGYYFFDKQNIIGLISNVNFQKGFTLQWSEEILGTAFLTLKAENKAGWMDKIIVKDGESIFSEVKKVKVVGSGNEAVKFINTNYDIVSVNKLLKFVNGESNLQTLTNFEIDSVDKNKLIINSESLIEGDSVSILYEFNPTYLIIEPLNDYRNSYKKIGSPQKVLQNLPIRFMIKRLHFIFNNL